MEHIVQFLTGIWPTVLTLVTTVAIPFLLGNDAIGATRMIRWIKKQLGWKGPRVLFIVLGVSFGLSFLVAIADGVISPETAGDPDRMVAIMISVITGSQVFYQMLKGREEGVS